MRRLLLCIAIALATGATVLAPAAGAVEPDAQRTRNAVDVVRPVDDHPPRIRCRGSVNDAGAPVVRCRWTRSHHPDAAGYEIVRRGGMEGRTVVFATRDLDVNRFVDTSVDFKTRYAYRVVVVDESGHRLEASRWNRAFVRHRDIERLRLRCTAGTLATDTVESDASKTEPMAEPELAADVRAATCTWRPATSQKAATYELWRLVRGADERELVATTGLDRTSVVDDDIPADAALVVYGVLAKDDGGHVVGRSHLSRVRFAVTDAS